jgi:DUF1009 family protein
MTAYRKLGLIAGAGELPMRIAAAHAERGAEIFVARIAGIADPALASYEGGEYGLGQVGERLRALKKAGCDAIVFAGLVKRPEFASLKLDAEGMLLLPAVIAASRKGDDALLRVLVQEHEKRGFRVIGAEEALGALTASEGALGARAPDAAALEDIAKGAAVAAAIGAWDIGQGCVVCEGLVLAVEAQEGTDAMLARVAELPVELRGRPEARRGVLVKRPKPIQERRIDLPTIGVRTVERAAAAGLAGIAIEAGAALVIDREAVIAAADRYGLFVYGFRA